jgi:hypothetical protein
MPGESNAGRKLALSSGGLDILFYWRAKYAIAMFTAGKTLEQYPVPAPIVRKRRLLSAASSSSRASSTP